MLKLVKPNRIITHGIHKFFFNPMSYPTFKKSYFDILVKLVRAGGTIVLSFDDCSESDFRCKVRDIWNEDTGSIHDPSFWSCIRKSLLTVMDIIHDGYEYSLIVIGPNEKLYTIYFRKSTFLKEIRLHVTHPSPIQGNWVFAGDIFYYPQQLVTISNIGNQAMMFLVHHPTEGAWFGKGPGIMTYD